MTPTATSLPPDQPADNEPYVLVLYHSRYGSVQQLARLIAQGVAASGVATRIRTVPAVSAVTSVAEPAIPPQGELYCSMDDLAGCAGLALGSPTWFGNMTAPMKHFWDNTTSLWLAGTLQGKPATVFTSSSSMHGGQESTLLTMMVPLLHHGMLLMGVPYAVPELATTTSGGGPYGASHVAGSRNDQPLHPDERAVCLAQGQRLGELVQQLRRP